MPLRDNLARGRSSRGCLSLLDARSPGLLSRRVSTRIAASVLTGAVDCLSRTRRPPEADRNPRRTFCSQVWCKSRADLRGISPFLHICRRNQ